MLSSPPQHLANFFLSPTLSETSTESSEPPFSRYFFLMQDTYGTRINVSYCLVQSDNLQKRHHAALSGACLGTSLRSPVSFL